MCVNNVYMQFNALKQNIPLIYIDFFLCPSYMSEYHWVIRTVQGRFLALDWFTY